MIVVVIVEAKEVSKEIVVGANISVIVYEPTVPMTTVWLDSLGLLLALEYAAAKGKVDGGDIAGTLEGWWNGIHLTPYRHKGVYNYMPSCCARNDRCS